MLRQTFEFGISAKPFPSGHIKVAFQNYIVHNLREKGIDPIYINLQNIQPSKSIMESIHESNTGSAAAGHRSQGGQVRILILGIVLSVLLLLGMSIVPFTVALHGNVRNSSAGYMARMNAGETAVQQTAGSSQAAYEANIAE